MCAFGARDRRVAIARQVNEPPVLATVEEVDGLSPSRRLTHERKTIASRERVDRTRLARIRSTRKRDFRSGVRRKLLRIVRRRKKAHAAEWRHRSLLSCVKVAP